MLESKHPGPLARSATYYHSLPGYWQYVFRPKVHWFRPGMLLSVNRCKGKLIIVLTQPSPPMDHFATKCAGTDSQSPRCFFYQPPILEAVGTPGVLVVLSSPASEHVEPDVADPLLAGDPPGDSTFVALPGNSLFSSSEDRLRRINWQNDTASQAVKRLAMSSVVIRSRSGARKGNTGITCCHPFPYISTECRNVIGK